MAARNAKTGGSDGAPSDLEETSASLPKSWAKLTRVNRDLGRFNRFFRDWNCLTSFFIQKVSLVEMNWTRTIFDCPSCTILLDSHRPTHH